MTRRERFALWAAQLRAGLRDYFGRFARQRAEPLNDREALRRFLDTRANFIAQTSLYGYLRTRAGMLYPQLFDNDEYVRGINIAKWHVWLACLSDLAVYAGGLLAHDAGTTPAKVRACMSQLIESILQENGTPPDAGSEFRAHADRVRSRIADTDWAGVTDDESAFTESPLAVVRWAPVIDNLKELDEAIVKNSVRFRWQEVRRDLRANLNAGQILASID